MRSLNHFAIVACLVYLPFAVHAESPDGTTYTHSVIAVEGPAIIRIKYCGIPIQVRLANVQTKGADSEKSSQDYLKSNLHSGTMVKVELEAETPADGIPLVHLFVAGNHVNLEMIKQGLAISDGRSGKYGAALQAAQLTAMETKQGIWLNDKSAPAVVAKTEPPKAAVVPVAVVVDTAPPDYSGPVVADLSSKEYHYPESRFARSIRAGAKIEYKSPEEAERAGKIPSPYSFPDRVKARLAKAPSAGATREKIVEDARQSLSEALGYMQEARRLARKDNTQANENWKKAAKLLAINLDRLTPVADSNPDDKDVQKLAEEMSMNMYSCNKYQSL